MTLIPQSTSVIGALVLSGLVILVVPVCSQDSPTPTTSPISVEGFNMTELIEQLTPLKEVIEDNFGFNSPTSNDTNKTSRQLRSLFEEESRGRKIKKRGLMKILILVKTMAAALILPSILALALFASWKGLTLSLLAFMLASIIGVKGLISKASDSSSSNSQPHVIVAKVPSPSSSFHEHRWRSDQITPETTWQEEHMAYRGYRK